MKISSLTALALALAFIQAITSAEPTPLASVVIRIPVTFSDGHETDGRDGGRPVVLIAAGLGVPTEVFRETFTHVHPAGPGRGPTEAEARANKAALMAGLGKYGVTNDRLDEVSNYYRYMKSRGEMWKTEPAVANALVKDGAVTGFEIVSGGAGYSSPPTVRVPGVNPFKATVELSFGKDLKSNGAVAAIKLVPAGAK